LEWYISAAITVEELRRTLNVIKQFLQKPIALDGKNASQLMRKKRHRRRRRSPSPDPDDEFSADDPVRKRRKEKKEKEKEVYKSAQFIEDSDVEYGDMDTFLEKEKMARERTILAAATSGNTRPANMKPTGTRKRQKKGSNNDAKSKGRKSDDLRGHSFGERNRSDRIVGDDDSTDHVANTSDPHSPQHAPRPRPRPRLRRKDGAPSASRSSPVPNLEDDIC
jgi:replication fork protection complex subunit Tof1/Swi1